MLSTPKNCDIKTGLQGQGVSKGPFEKLSFSKYIPVETFINTLTKRIKENEKTDICWFYNVIAMTLWNQLMSVFVFYIVSRGKGGSPGVGNEKFSNFQSTNRHSFFLPGHGIFLQHIF